MVMIKTFIEPIKWSIADTLDLLDKKVNALEASEIHSVKDRLYSNKYNPPIGEAGGSCKKHHIARRVVYSKKV